MTEESSQEKEALDNIVYIGNRPPMNYVPVVIAMFNLL